MKRYPCIRFNQRNYRCVLFSVSAKELFDLVKINRREEDKRKGYQRALQPERATQIARFIDSGQPIPTNIVVAFDHARLSNNGREIQIEESGDAGWVIDGQHRLAGAYEAATDINLAVTGFLGLTEEQQIEQFVIINKEAKRVPTSLYYDLLPDLKSITKSEADIAKERAVDLANEMKVDEASVFFNRIASLRSPARGQLSLTNFVRKVAPLVHRTNGVFRTLPARVQRGILENYFTALANVFPREYEASDSIFFRTIGFGALINALPRIYDITVARTNVSFKAADAIETLQLVEDYDFARWRTMGTGNAAELAAGTELADALISAAGPEAEDESSIQV
jgi:DGQHR domain-containing protein